MKVEGDAMLRYVNEMDLESLIFQAKKRRQYDGEAQGVVREYCHRFAR